MIHKMKLNSKSFEKMKNGKKTIEYRLNDKKTKLLRYGNSIIFEKDNSLNEKLLMEIKELKTFNSFKEAFKELKSIPNSDVGGDIEKRVNEMYETYKESDEQKYGCLAVILVKQTLVDIVFEYKNNQLKNDELIMKLNIIKNNGDISDKYFKDFEKLILEIEKESKKGDGIVVFSEILDLLNNNQAYHDIAKKMTPHEVMKLATKRLMGEVPAIYSESLDEIIDAAIDSDIPENVWRMALNYDYEIKDKSKLEDYIIAKKDAWYIVEFISSEFIVINLDKLVDGLIATTNLKEMSYLVRHFKLCSNLEEYSKAIIKLENAIKEIDGGWEFYQDFLKK